MDLEKLTVSERISLAEALWDSVANHDEKIHLTDEQKKELDSRLANFQTDKNLGLSWEEVKKSITS